MIIRENFGFFLITLTSHAQIKPSLLFSFHLCSFPTHLSSLFSMLPSFTKLSSPISFHQTPSKGLQPSPHLLLIELSPHLSSRILPSLPSYPFFHITNLRAFIPTSTQKPFIFLPSQIHRTLILHTIIIPSRNPSTPPSLDHNYSSTTRILF